MKKSILIAALFASSLLFQKADAQVRISFRANIGIQPGWGPIGYDHVEYYYLPDIDAYYYVPSAQYVYLQRGRWTFGATLPGRYRDYDINTGYKVVVNDRTPYRRAAIYRTRYASFKGNRDQGTISNSHDSKYFENRNHPEHNKWKQERNRERNERRRRGNDRGNDHDHHD